jgi:Holliday junction resolvase-like predicted endonuclease
MKAKVKCPHCNCEFEVAENVYNLKDKEYIEFTCQYCKIDLIVYKKMNPTFVALKQDECTCTMCKNITTNPKTEKKSELFPKEYKKTEKILCKRCWMIMLYEEFFLRK